MLRCPRGRLSDEATVWLKRLRTRCMAASPAAETQARCRRWARPPPTALSQYLLPSNLFRSRICHHGCGRRASCSRHVLFRPNQLCVRSSERIIGDQPSFTFQRCSNWLVNQIFCRHQCRPFNKPIDLWFLFCKSALRQNFVRFVCQTLCLHQRQQFTVRRHICQK